MGLFPSRHLDTQYTPTRGLLTLPNELWLQILECAKTPQDIEHLWISVRRVSRSFKDYVERLFVSTYLSRFGLTITLPLEQPNVGSVWTGNPPHTQIFMEFDKFISDQRFALFISPVMLRKGGQMWSVEELREKNILPRERLMTSYFRVHVDNDIVVGQSLKIPKHIDWDSERKVWVWKIEWKPLVVRFYGAKIQARSKMRIPSHRVKAIPL